MHVLPGGWGLYERWMRMHTNDWPSWLGRAARRRWAASPASDLIA